MGSMRWSGYIAFSLWKCDPVTDDCEQALLGQPFAPTRSFAFTRTCSTVSVFQIHLYRQLQKPPPLAQQHPLHQKRPSTTSLYCMYSSEKENAESAELTQNSGDSYSQTGFDLAGTKPALGNQMGNPPYPGWTTSGGPNWVGDLVQPNSQLLAYNLASGGATTDAALVTPFASTVLSFVDQVTKFTTNLAPPPAYAPWTAADSLFAIWIGVNDVGNAWYRAEWPTLSQQIVDRYFTQVQALYNAGGRKFVFLSVPPIERAPANLLVADAGSLAAIKAAVLHYNDLLAAGANAFIAANPGVYAKFIDVLPKFNLVLDAPTVYGAANSTCYNADGVSCLWWNDYHPGLVLQNGAADDVAVIVGLYL